MIIIKSSKYGYLIGFGDGHGEQYGDDVFEAMCFSEGHGVDIAESIDDPQDPHITTLQRNGNPIERELKQSKINIGPI